MFFPKCPKCGGKSVSAEGDTVSYGNRHIKLFAAGQRKPKVKQPVAI